MKRIACITTTGCNLRCRHCSREGTQTNTLSADVLDMALPMAQKMGYGVVAFTGGEPCLHPQFKDLVNIAVNNGFRIQFVTNGTMMSHYEFIYENHRKKIALVAMSIDGASKEVHETIRGAGTYDAVMESVAYSKSQKVAPKILTTLNKLNMHEIEDIYWKCMRLGVSHLSFCGTTSTDYNQDIVLNHQERVKCVQRINALVRLRKMSVTYATSLLAQDLVDFCSAFRMNSLTINSKNEVVPCCDLVGDGVSVGSLLEEDFLTLFLKSMDAMHALKKEKARLLASGDNELNGCEFCNAYLQRVLEGHPG